MGSKELVRMAGVERTKARFGEAWPCNTNVLFGEETHRRNFVASRPSSLGRNVKGRSMRRPSSQLFVIDSTSADIIPYVICMEGNAHAEPLGPKLRPARIS